MEPGTAADLPALSRREHRLARLVAAGLSDVEIGTRLATDPLAVEAELGSLVGKLRLRSRTELALFSVLDSTRRDARARRE